MITDARERYAAVGKFKYQNRIALRMNLAVV